MADEFSNKVVMVTGAGGNLGEAVSRRFARAGAALIMIERNPDTLKRLTTEIGGEGDAADVTDPVAVDALVTRLEKRFDHIDILVHTVGGFAMGQAVHESNLDTWNRMMAVNAQSLFVTCGRVARHMVERQIKGRIIAVVARNAYKATAKTAAYSASKAAAQRIIESMAAELKENGITVNAIAPSSIDTPQNRAAMPNADFSKWVQPEEIANAMTFLASEEARSITGITLDIFGRA